MKRLLYLLPAALGLSLIVVGCGGGQLESDPGGREVDSTAPEIAGQDAEGKTFKLSDYRGKVVLLDFWGNW